MVDLSTALRAVVLPAIEAAFREGEVAAVDVRACRGSVQLSLTAGGETYDNVIVQAAARGQSLEDWRERLRSNLADFVAERRFGWGENRDQASS